MTYRSTHLKNISHKVDRSLSFRLAGPFSAKAPASNRTASATSWGSFVTRSQISVTSFLGRNRGVRGVFGPKSSIFHTFRATAGLSRPSRSPAKAPRPWGNPRCSRPQEPERPRETSRRLRHRRCALPRSVPCLAHGKKPHFLSKTCT